MGEETSIICIQSWILPKATSTQVSNFRVNMPCMQLVEVVSIIAKIYTKIYFCMYACSDTETATTDEAPKALVKKQQDKSCQRPPTKELVVRVPCEIVRHACVNKANLICIIILIICTTQG